MQDWKPIRKVAAGFVAAAVLYAARRLGVDLGEREVNEAALAFVGVVTAYIVRGRT